MYTDVRSLQRCERTYHLIASKNAVIKHCQWTSLREVQEDHQKTRRPTSGLIALRPRRPDVPKVSKDVGRVTHDVPRRHATPIDNRRHSDRTLDRTDYIGATSYRHDFPTSLFPFPGLL